MNSSPTFSRRARGVACTALAAVLASLCAGCASPYWRGRRADAADVFTATAGIGIGATARIGPLHAGLGANTDFYGIEAGESVQGGLGLLVVGAGYEASDAAFGPFGRSVVHLGTDARRRGKNNVPPSGERGLRPIPFWDPPEPAGGNPARWTQIEVAAGLLGGVRLGFNPGELLDLLLGFFGVDLYDDDIAGLPSDEKTPAERRWEASCALAQERADRARRRRLDRALDRCGFSATRALALEDRSSLSSWRPSFADAGWEERPCTLAGGGFKWYKASPAADGGRHNCEIGVFVAESAEAAHDAMAGRLEWWIEHGDAEIRVATGGGEPGDVCAKYGSDDFRWLWFRRGNVLVEVRNDEGLARALDTQILAAMHHAEFAELNSHAERAENAEPEPRAESAEFAEH